MGNDKISDCIERFFMIKTQVTMRSLRDELEITKSFRC